MKKTNIFSLTVLTLLAGCALQLQAGTFSDLLNKFKPAVLRMAAWRQCFTTKVPVLNNTVVKQEAVKPQPELEPLKEGIQRIFQEEYEPQKGAFTCGYYVKRNSKPLDYNEKGNAKLTAKHFEKETQADGSCDFQSPYKKVINWKFTDILSPKEKTVVVAMCPVPDCKMFTIWELGRLTHCEKTGKVIQLTKGAGKIK